MDSAFPLGLQFGEHFFAQVAALAPTLGELVQLASNALPIRALGMLCGPSFKFFDQGQTLGFVGRSLGAGFFEPSIDHHMGFVTSGIKSLPQSGIGRCLLVDFFPFLTQMTQGFLHLPATHGGHLCWGIRLRHLLRGITRCLRWLKQSFGLHREFKPLLVYQYFIARGFDFTGGVTGYASRRGGGGVCGNFCLMGWRLRGVTHLANLFSPSRHGWQWRLRVCSGGFGQLQGIAKCQPNGLQLLGAGLQSGGEFGVHARPLRVVGQALGLCVPTV